MDRKKILFVTGTRADYGKLKPLIQSVNDHPNFQCKIFGTGMHLMARYGNTISEIQKANVEDVFPFMNQVEGDSMEIILSNTVKGISRYLHEHQIDMVVIHGDRVEALAGAIVGALRNILTAHVEGGEISGTIDELIRHSTSKLAHVHFVASSDARNRLLQLGEKEESVFHIGSPDIDIMFSDSLPTIEMVKDRYEIEYDRYGIAILHPVTTDLENQLEEAKVFVKALIKSKLNYVVIYPNNDMGSDYIIEAYKNLEKHSNFKMFPSLRFEYFLTLLKKADFIIGNSSVGIHEAPVYGVPTVNVGDRQNNRLVHESIINVEFNLEALTKLINNVKDLPRFDVCNHYGDGNSAKKFIEIIEGDKIWETPKQKQFTDLLNTL